MTLGVSSDVGPHFEFCLAQECAAAESYLRFVFDDFDHALSVQRFLGERGLLESSPPYGRVLLQAGQPIGMVSGVPGADLRRLRMKAAYALQKTPSLGVDAAILERMHRARQALLTPLDTDYYSSKLGVSPAARGTGAGPLLMRHISEEARDRGFLRAVGEVSPANAAMMRVMCDKVGWARVDQRRVDDPASGRSLEYVHLALVCRP